MEKINIRCSSCRSSSTVEITERTYGPNYKYLYTPVKFCPVCAISLDKTDITIINYDSLSPDIQIEEDMEILF